jgi:O-acetyl-ADP-ribose deacetylase (regulator of RNase III)
VIEEETHTLLGGRVRLLTGDITRQKVDAIVNAANSTLMGGAGVDGAIHRAGGAAILEECLEIRRKLYPHGLPTGEAVLTTAGDLPARHVIHTVGPIYGQHSGREAELLARCYRNSLKLASQHALSSVAFPAISTGAFGYPRDEAARVASQAIEQFLAEDKSSMLEIRLIFFMPGDLNAFLKSHSFSQR